MGLGFIELDDEEEEWDDEELESEEEDDEEEDDGEYDILGHHILLSGKDEQYFRRVMARPGEIEAYRAMGRREWQRLNALTKFDNFEKVLDDLEKKTSDDVVQCLIENGVYDYSSDMLTHRYRDAAKVMIEKFTRPVQMIVGSKASNLQKLSQLKKFLSSSETQRAMMDIFGAYRANGHALEDEILSEKYIGGWGHDFDTNRAVVLCENCLKAGNISRSQQKDILYQAFKANPLSTKVIETAMRLGLDDSGGLAKFAEHFGLLASNPASQSHGGLNQAGGDAVRTLCNKFLLSHNASLFQCTPKLKAALGIANMDDGDIYLARDDTVLKSGKNGFAITKNGIYCRDVAAKPTHVSFEMLACASKFTKKLSGGIYADKTIIALSSECGKDLVQLFTDIAKAVQ